MVLNAHDFSGVYEPIGLGLDGLGCVMLGVEPIPVRKTLGPDLEQELFWHPDPAKFWVKGPVGEEGGHVTLLYGILKHLWRDRDVPASYFAAVEEVLADWEQPREVWIDTFEMWTPPDGGPYRTLVGKLSVDQELKRAHQLLSLLPHVDTFLDYTPHVTLAYVKEHAAADALSALTWELDPTLTTTRLDYGHGA